MNNTADPSDQGAPGVDVSKTPSTPRRKKKPTMARWVVLGVVAVVIGLVASTVKGSAFVYSKYVDELAAPGEAQRWVGRVVRVEGLVAPASIENRPGSNEFRFRVERNRATLQVHYRGIVPDTFRDCAGVTVRGTLSANGMFEAEEIVAKCPSKYEAATVQNGQCVVGPAATPGASAQRM